MANHRLPPDVAQTPAAEQPVDGQGPVADDDAAANGHPESECCAHGHAGIPNWS